MLDYQYNSQSLGLGKWLDYEATDSSVVWSIDG